VSSPMLWLNSSNGMPRYNADYRVLKSSLRVSILLSLSLLRKRPSTPHTTDGSPPPRLHIISASVRAPSYFGPGKAAFQFCA
jgi:hypothetical protein